MRQRFSDPASYDGVVDDAPGHGDVDPAKPPAVTTHWRRTSAGAWAVVFRAYVTAAHDAVAELPGGPRGYQVLSAAAQGTVGSQLALAQHLGIDRTVMTYLLDDLEAADLIERRPDPADRRARRVVATQHGSELLVELHERLRAAEAFLLTPLDQEAAESFRAQVRLLATRLDALDPLESPCELAEEVDAELPAPRRAAFDSLGVEAG